MPKGATHAPYFLYVVSRFSAARSVSESLLFALCVRSPQGLRSAAPPTHTLNAPPCQPHGLPVATFLAP